MSFQAPPGNRGIDRFEVSIEGGCITKTCTLAKSASPLQCQFKKLLPATGYVVKVRSCLPLSIGCSGNVTALAVTTPTGVLSAKPPSLFVDDNFLFHFTAPSNCSFVGITGYSVGVKIEEPKENNVIKHYEAVVKGATPLRACIVEANADTLMCTITGLSSAHEYTVGVKACVHRAIGCGPALEKSFRTG